MSVAPVGDPYCKFREKQSPRDNLNSVSSNEHHTHFAPSKMGGKRPPQSNSLPSSFFRRATAGAVVGGFFLVLCFSSHRCDAQDGDSLFDLEPNSGASKGGEASEGPARSGSGAGNSLQDLIAALSQRRPTRPSVIVDTRSNLGDISLAMRADQTDVVVRNRDRNSLFRSSSSSGDLGEEENSIVLDSRNQRRKDAVRGAGQRPRVVVAPVSRVRPRTIQRNSSSVIPRIPRQFSQLTGSSTENDGQRESDRPRVIVAPVSRRRPTRLNSNSILDNSIGSVGSGSSNSRGGGSANDRSEGRGLLDSVNDPRQFSQFAVTQDEDDATYHAQGEKGKNTQIIINLNHEPKAYVIGGGQEDKDRISQQVEEGIGAARDGGSEPAAPPGPTPPADAPGERRAVPIAPPGPPGNNRPSPPGTARPPGNSYENSLFDLDYQKLDLSNDVGGGRRPPTSYEVPQIPQQQSDVGRPQRYYGNRRDGIHGSAGGGGGAGAASQDDPNSLFDDTLYQQVTLFRRPTANGAQSDVPTPTGATAATYRDAAGNIAHTESITYQYSQSANLLQPLYESPNPAPAPADVPTPVYVQRRPLNPAPPPAALASDAPLLTPSTGYARPQQPRPQPQPQPQPPADAPRFPASQAAPTRQQPYNNYRAPAAPAAQSAPTRTPPPPAYSDFQRPAPVASDFGFQGQQQQQQFRPSYNYQPAPPPPPPARPPSDAPLPSYNYRPPSPTTPPPRPPADLPIPPPSSYSGYGPPPATTPQPRPPSDFPGVQRPSYSYGPPPAPPPTQRPQPPADFPQFDLPQQPRDPAPADVVNFRVHGTLQASVADDAGRGKPSYLPRNNDPVPPPRSNFGFDDRLSSSYGAPPAPARPRPPADAPLSSDPPGYRRPAQPQPPARPPSDVPVQPQFVQALAPAPVIFQQQQQQPAFLVQAPAPQQIIQTVQPQVFTAVQSSPTRNVQVLSAPPQRPTHSYGAPAPQQQVLSSAPILSSPQIFTAAQPAPTALNIYVDGGRQLDEPVVLQQAPRPTYGYGGGGGGVRLRSPRGGLLAGIQERLRLHCVFLCDFRHRGPVRAAAGKKK